MNKKKLPLLASRGLVLFPKMTIHLDVAREMTINAVKEAFKKNQEVVLAAQIDPDTDDIYKDNIYKVGTVAKIKQCQKTARNIYRIVAEGIERVRIGDIVLNDNYMVAEVTTLDIFNSDPDDVYEIKALVRKIKELYIQYLEITRKIGNSSDIKIIEMEDPNEITDLICSNFSAKLEILQDILGEAETKKRLELLMFSLSDEINILKFENEIDQRVKKSIDKDQREYFLRKKMYEIKDELGQNFDQEFELSKLSNRIEELPIDNHNKETLINEFKKLSYLGVMSQEYGVIKNYLDTVVRLPFKKEYSNFKTYAETEKILNNSHYGMKRVKEKILDIVSEKIYNNDYNGGIICLAGPPGVGKTSVAHSVADALGRKFAKISTGGMKDESEIRGHRKTYVGAMPGKIIDAFLKVKCCNPVFLIDEIDKISSDFRGDPASALLEVLDSEQNSNFTDNYIAIPFDISKALFIATANDIDRIPNALRDRLDIIELESYTLDEKIVIAKKYLIPKQAKLHKIKKYTLSNSQIKYIIENYTREAGVRQLERCISVICKKIVRNYILKNIKEYILDIKVIKEMLGYPTYKIYEIKNNDFSGVVNGLAWTQAGGALLKIETKAVPGTGKLEITGNLGEIMKESVYLALSVVKVNADKFKIPFDFMKNCDMHIHFPEGAVPKDGPSAGISITCSIISALTGKIVNSKYAMTGEITLNGNILPIGGVREKILAAFSSGMTDVILPKDNQDNVMEYFNGKMPDFIRIHFVKNIFEATKLVFNEKTDKLNLFAYRHKLFETKE